MIQFLTKAVKLLCLLCYFDWNSHSSVPDPDVDAHLRITMTVRFSSSLPKQVR